MWLPVVYTRLSRCTQRAGASAQTQQRAHDAGPVPAGAHDARDGGDGARDGGARGEVLQRRRLPLRGVPRRAAADRRLAAPLPRPPASAAPHQRDEEGGGGQPGRRPRVRPRQGQDEGQWPHAGREAALISVGAVESRCG